MDTAPKENCKYWEKCYQTNEAHRQKYVHPQPAAGNNAAETTAQTSTGIDGRGETEQDGHIKKRKSGGSDDSVISPKKNNTQRLWKVPDEEYLELVKTDKFIHAKFLVKMPKDFYQFWDFVSQIAQGKKKHPLSKMGLELVGPFDFMAGKFAEAEPKSPGEYLRHWRFYYDPPEFQTIFVKKGTGIHYGYWRDDPNNDESLLIARNDADIGCEMEFIATNAFDALVYFLEKDFLMTPFNQYDLSSIRKAINEFVTTVPVKRPPLFLAKSERWKIAAAKSFHGAGIVVPFDKKTTEGYRPLIESDANLKKILSSFEKIDTETGAETVMDKLQPVITASVIAMDELDFGTTLELGIDFFCSGYPQLHGAILTLLNPAYTLLKRLQFLAILKAHLDDRKKSFELSILN